jgi:hypothetical protein
MRKWILSGKRPEPGSASIEGSQPKALFFTTERTALNRLKAESSKHRRFIDFYLSADYAD